MATAAARCNMIVVRQAPDPNKIVNGRSRAEEVAASM